MSPDLPRARTVLPTTLAELERRFGSEDACVTYLERLRWRDGIRCPCGSERGWRTAKLDWSCAMCGRRISVKAGTIFDHTRQPLVLWFRLIWFVTSTRKRASAFGLQRLLELKRYETAWNCLKKLRFAMVPKGERLVEHVEVAAITVGRAEGVRSRGPLGDTTVAIAVEVQTGRLPRVRVARIVDASERRFTGFVVSRVQPGAEIYTEDTSGYLGLDSAGYFHKAGPVDRPNGSAAKLRRFVDSVAADLKSWFRTGRGAISVEQMDYYLDEFSFQFNNPARHPGIRFQRMLWQAVRVDTRQIVGRTEVREISPDGSKGR